MGLFDRFKPRPATPAANSEGLLGYFGLTDWWLQAFSDQERALVEERYQPMGMSAERPLTSGAFHSSSQTATHLLSYLAEWVNKPGERHLARCILAKAAELADSENAPVLDRHFLQQHILQANYPDRDDPEAMAAAIRACEGQIALAEQAATAFRAEYPGQPLPQHVGYKQLTIIHDKQGDYDAAITLCKRARAQGWNGDWDTRIARLEKKAGKNGAT